MKSEAERSSRSVVGAVIVCAGRGERTGLPYNKVLHVIGKKTVAETVLDAFSATSVAKTVLVVAANDVKRMRELANGYGAQILVGGATRAESVKIGLEALDGCDIVVIHDGARPFVTPELIERTIVSAREHGSGIAAVRAVDTVKRVSADGKIAEHLDRSELYRVQTPQTFRYAEILAAYAALGRSALDCTDDSEVYGRAGFSPTTVEGDYSNTKITTIDDLYSVRTSSFIRIGVGFDIHRLVTGRKLVLGGVEIPHAKGLDGHSDADVLTHAIMDALLSAADEPDIGVLFPDTDDKYAGISSLILLDRVNAIIKKKGLTVTNISAVVIAQAPKLAPHIDAIRQSLASRLGIDRSMINVSATTAEKLGEIGNGDAIAANASCLLGKL